MSSVQDRFHGFQVAYNMLHQGVDPTRATNDQFKTLATEIGREKVPFAERMAFEDKLETWPGFKGLPARYFVASYYQGDYRDQAKQIEAELSSVGDFVQKGDSKQARGALDMVAASGRSSLKKLEKLLDKSDHRSIYDEIKVPAVKVAVLKTLALLGRNDDGSFPPGSAAEYANNLADALKKQLETFDATRCADQCWGLQSGESLENVQTTISSAAKALSNAPDAREAIVAQAQQRTTPEQREQFIERALNAGSAHSPDGSAYRGALELAKIVFEIDHPGAPFQTSAGSHPVLGRLFAHAGQEVLIDVGEQKVRGTLVQLRDQHPDKEGSAPTASLVSDGNIYHVDLTIAKTIESQGSVLFDASKEAAPTRRQMAKLDAEEQALTTAIVGQYVVGDYNINHEKVAALADKVADKVPGGRELLDQAKAEKAPGYALQQIEGTIVARAIAPLLEKDLGPANLSELATAGFGATQRGGYKMWAMDVGESLALGGGSFSGMVESTKERAYDTLDTLQRGTTQERRALIRAGVAGLGPDLLDIQKKGVPVSEDLKAKMLAFFEQSAAALK